MPFTLFSVVGVINAFNMIDGLDGLAGGLALIAAGWLAVLCLTGPAPNPTAAYLLLTLVMVLAGFLAWNLRHPWRRKAKVFMGDAGSTLLGFALGWFMIDLSQGDEQAVMAPITALWIMALPLMDTITVMIRRLRAGQSPFAGDRQHLHHLLLATGRTDARVTAILLGCGLMTGGIGAAAWWLACPNTSSIYAFFAIFILYYQGTTRTLGTAERSAEIGPRAPGMTAARIRAIWSKSRNILRYRSGVTDEDPSLDGPVYRQGD